MEKKKHRLRILFNSNALWSNSGYGQQTAEIVPLIDAEGYHIACSNFYGQSGGMFVLEGLPNVPQYPVINHVYGSDALVLHGKDFNADVVMTLQDVHILNPQDLGQVKRWIPWLPIDQDPMPEIISQNLRFAYRIISMSHFGEKQLLDKGFASTYIPHSVNTDIFKPLDKLKVREKFKVPPDAFLVGMVGANKEDPPRKGFQQALEAFKMLVEKVPQALMYIHTFNDFPGGFNVKYYANKLGIGDKIAIPDPYQTNFKTFKKDMAVIMNTFDVLLAPSMSEGFGIPIIEAQACGVPAVVTDFTAMPELVRDRITGYRSKLLYKRASPAGSYYGIADVEDIYNGLWWAYSADRKNVANQCVKWIEDNFATKKIWSEKWLPFLQKVENEVYPPESLLDKK